MNNTQILETLTKLLNAYIHNQPTTFEICKFASLIIALYLIIFLKLKSHEVWRKVYAEHSQPVRNRSPSQKNREITQEQLRQN